MKRKQNEKHLSFIRSLPCCTCPKTAPCEAAHIRMGTNGGMGLKPTSEWVVPMCHKCHNLEQHRVGENAFWPDIALAKQLANNLHTVTGDDFFGKLAVMNYRRKHMEDKAYA